MPNINRPKVHGSVRGGKLTTTGVQTQALNMRSADQYHGFNSVFIWGTWNGHTVKLQAQCTTGAGQLVPPAPATGNWIDIPEMSLTTNGIIQPQVIADFFRIHKGAATGTPNLNYQVR